MSENTKIQWADHTFNPWIGCTKVSPGCANCYAEGNTAVRFMGITWGKGHDRYRTKSWAAPIGWNKRALKTGTRYKVFPSLCDWLDEEVPIDWLADFLKLIHDTPNIDWLLLTKRPENFIPKSDALADYGHEVEDWFQDWVEGRPPSNVRFGVSVENQALADKRIPELLKINAAIRFLSAEPLLGDIDFTHAAPCGYYCDLSGIDWVIVGGESGHNARPCNVEWVRSIVQQCKAAGVACFVKQLGSNVLSRNDAGFDGKSPTEWPMDPAFREIDPGVYKGAPVRVRLRHPKGGEPSEWPEDLRVREFPKLKEAA